MSCDYTKLCYLEETKRLFREKIDPNGEKITDETPFRDYVHSIAGKTFGNAFFVTNAVPLSLSKIGVATKIEEV